MTGVIDVTAALELAEDLALPLDVVSRRTAIVGQTDTGKTSTAVVMVEEARAQGAQVVVIDPSGAWWGITSSQDGESPGLDMVVLGGEHGDVPLSRTAGAAIARMVCDTGHSCVLDLDRPHFTSWGARMQFVAEFLGTLYERARSQILVVIDEAHRFAPQNTRGDDEAFGPRCLGAVNDVVALGRRRGLGCVVITQRLAKLNKDVLELCELMIAHRLRGPNDLKALQGWLEAAGENVKATMATVAQLAKGQAHVSAPTLEIDGVFQIRRKQTFDSSASIGVGDVAAAPATRSEVDLDALQALISESIAEAEADDPKTLKRRIVELERQLNEDGAEVGGAMEFADLAHERDRAVAERDSTRIQLEDAITSIHDHELRMEWVREGLQAVLDGKMVRRDFVADSDTKESGQAGYDKVAAAPDPPAEATTKRSETTHDVAPPASAVTGLQREILEALAAFHPRELTARQLGMYLGKSSGGGYFRNMLGALRSAGYLDGLVITDAGLAAVGGPRKPRTKDQMVELWRAKLSGLQLAMFDLLLAHPEGLTSVEIGVALDKSSTAGYFRNVIGGLRGRGLVVTQKSCNRVAEEFR